MKKIFRNKKSKVLKTLDDNNLGSLARTILSCFVVVLSFYSLPIIVNFANDKILKDVCGWLMINLMRSEKIQFDLLCEHSVKNVWRKVAYNKLIDQYKEIGMDADSIANKITKFYQDNVIDLETYNKNIKN